MQCNIKSTYARNIQRLLEEEVGNSHITPSIYDNAWVARLSIDNDQRRPLFPDILENILEGQKKDGSWRHSDRHIYVHDAYITTLSVVVSLIGWHRRGYLSGSTLIQKGIAYLESSVDELCTEEYGTVGFELLAPALLVEAREYGVNIETNQRLRKVEEKRARKIKVLHENGFADKASTGLHSIEGMVGIDIDWGRIRNISDKNGALLSSVSSSVYYYLKTLDNSALEYINSTIQKYRYAPVNSPMDIFEINWSIEILLKLGLETFFEEGIASLSRVLENNWTNKGISWASTFTLPDLDDTAVTFYLLKKLHSPLVDDVDDSFFDSFMNDHGKYQCFPGELDSSPTHLLHLLQAVCITPVKTHKYQKLYEETRDKLVSLRWKDKWHLSPYYVYAIAYEVTQTFDPRLANWIISEIKNTQNADGGWGKSSNLEETAWACFTLLCSPGGDDGTENRHLSAGIEYIKHCYEEVDSFQWIDKCLYSPRAVVRILRDAVLMRYELLCETLENQKTRRGA